MTVANSAPLINRERAAHWYYPDGSSCHTQPKKDGSGDRATTLADARKLGLFPSVTSILSIKAKPGLDAWKLEQAILSALTLPKGTEETEDAFARRIVEDMDAQAAKAAEWGTKIHGEVEEMHKTGVMIQRDDTYPFIEDYERWFKENVVEVIKAEETVVNSTLGYAGRVDLVAVTKQWGPAVIDFKTQKVKKEAVFYPEYGIQLSAYEQPLICPAYPKGLAKVSVVINSVKPDKVAVKVWEDDTRYFKAFKACVDLWQFDRNYNPLEVISKK